MGLYRITLPDAVDDGTDWGVASKSLIADGDPVVLAPAAEETSSKMTASDAGALGALLPATVHVLGITQRVRVKGSSANPPRVTLNMARPDLSTPQTIEFLAFVDGYAWYHVGGPTELWGTTWTRAQIIALTTACELCVTWPPLPPTPPELAPLEIDGWNLEVHILEDDGPPAPPAGTAVAQRTLKRMFG